MFYVQFSIELLYTIKPLLLWKIVLAKSLKSACMVSVVRVCTPGMLSIGLTNETLLHCCVMTERRLDATGRPYFLNHNNRTTQWEDPRQQM